jgi:hypothetical protein
MILLLLGLEILALLHLLRFQFLLLLLESHIVLGVAGVWSGGTLRGRNILGVDCWCRPSVLDCRRRAIRSGFRTRSLVGWTRNFAGWSSSLVCRASDFVVRSSRLVRWPRIVIFVGGMNGRASP